MSDTIVTMGRFRVSRDGSPLESRAAAGMWRSINPGRARAPTRVRAAGPVGPTEPSLGLGRVRAGRPPDVPSGFPVFGRARGAGSAASAKARLRFAENAAQTFAENAISRRRHRLRAMPLEEA